MASLFVWLAFSIFLNFSLAAVPNWVWKGWDSFPSLHFACNTSGPENVTQLQQDALYQMVVYEFRHEMYDGNWTDEEYVLETQCQALKKLSPTTPCIVYRSGCWAGAMFKLGEEAINLGANNDWFIQVQGPPSASYDFNWTVKDGASFFINNISVEIANEMDVDGVFFDDMETDACGLRNAGFNMTKYQKQLQFNDSLDVYLESFKVINNANQFPLFSTWDAFSSIPWADFQAPPTSKCPYYEDKIYDALTIKNNLVWARYYEFFMWAIGPSKYVDNPNNNNQCQAFILNIIEESKRNIPIVARTPYCPSIGGSCGNGQIENGSPLDSTSNNTFYNILVLYDILMLQANDLGNFVVSTLYQSQDEYVYFQLIANDDNTFYIICKADGRYFGINTDTKSKYYGVLMTFDSPQGDWSKFMFTKINVSGNNNYGNNDSYIIRCKGNNQALFANETNTKEPWITTINEPDNKLTSESYFIMEKQSWYTEDEWLEFSMNSFLIGVSEYSYFGFSNNDLEGGGWFDQDWHYHEQYQTYKTGKPIGYGYVANDTNGYVFQRQFTNATVTVDCYKGTSNIKFKSYSYI